jgi:antitoxin MazE
MQKTEIVKWGNSLAVRIPKVLAAQAQIKEGDSVTIEASDGQLEVKAIKKAPMLKTLVARITADNRYSETDWGGAVGAEKLEW